MAVAARLKVLALAGLALAACQGPLDSPETAGAGASVRVELGTVVDSDGRVSMPRTVFSRADTVRVSFERTLALGDTVTVRWIRVDGKEPGVAIDSVVRIAEGTGAPSFAASPAEGWTEGRYAAEVSIAGSRVGTGTFEVR